MDKISKVLQKFSAEEKEKIISILICLKSGKMSGLDLKKLKGRPDIFRVRKGKIRILYRKSDKGGIYILTIERRNENTYNF
ncbi:MAG: hypothetical protein HY452_01600 [Parcubacteria group bacterium]|uniref:Type II toxin-antitoxin system RelE/ParE family toxin n=1 Tax=Candidatus Sungiibacteriota bacterium TaxID=2750080 RepID=A0A9D6HQR5_9BACT|nr:hypothetical protein [Candidatus Sungbacteria bacterium]MBI4118936.1 hypothetical protein [Parcubacteria group bacterium]